MNFDEEPYQEPTQLEYLEAHNKALEAEIERLKETLISKAVGEEAFIPSGQVEAWRDNPVNPAYPLYQELKRLKEAVNWNAEQCKDELEAHGHTRDLANEREKEIKRLKSVADFEWGVKQAHIDANKELTDLTKRLGTFLIAERETGCIDPKDVEAWDSLISDYRDLLGE